jgi:hypothetical protein
LIVTNSTIRSGLIVTEALKVKRGVAVLAILTIIMLIGGVLTAGVWDGFPIMRQTSDPMGSYFAATPGQAALFFIVVTALIAGAITNGLIIGLLIWFFNREVKATENIPTRSEREAAEVLPETVS